MQSNVNQNDQNNIENHDEYDNNIGQTESLTFSAQQRQEQQNYDSEQISYNEEHQSKSNKELQQYDDYQQDTDSQIQLERQTPDTRINYPSDSNTARLYFNKLKSNDLAQSKIIESSKKTIQESNNKNIQQFQGNQIKNIISQQHSTRQQLQQDQLPQLDKIDYRFSLIEQQYLKFNDNVYLDQPFIRKKQQRGKLKEKRQKLEAANGPIQKKRKKKKYFQLEQLKKLEQCLISKQYTKHQLREKFNIAGSTLQNYIARFIENKGSLFNDDKYPKTRKVCPKLSQKRKKLIKAVQKILQQNPMLSLAQIKQKLSRFYDIHLTKSTLSRLFKKLKIVKKKFKKCEDEINKPQAIDMRYTYCKKYLELNLERTIFLDQYSLSRKHPNLDQWSKTGKKVYIPNFDNKQQSYTIIAVMTFKRVEQFSLIYGPAQHTDIVEFAKNHLQRFKGYTLVMDNSVTHKTKLIRDTFETLKIQVLFLPPYTPQLNPLQIVFHQFKHLMKIYQTQGQQPLEAIKRSMKRLAGKNYQSCKKRINHFIEIGIKKEPIEIK